MNQENTPSKTPSTPQSATRSSGKRTRRLTRSATALAKRPSNIDLSAERIDVFASAKRPPRDPNLGWHAQAVYAKRLESADGNLYVPDGARPRNLLIEPPRSQSNRKAAPSSSRRANSRQISFTMADCEKVSTRLEEGKKSCRNPNIKNLKDYKRANNNEKHWGMPDRYCILYRELPVLPSDYARTDEILESIIRSRLPPKDYLSEKFANGMCKTSVKMEVRNLRKGVKQKVEVGNDMLRDNKLYEALKNRAGSLGRMNAASEATVGTVDDQASGQSRNDEVMEILKQGAELSLNNAKTIKGMQEDTKAYRATVEEQFTGVRGRLDGLDERSDSHDRRLHRIEGTMSALKLWGPDWESTVERRYSGSDNKIVNNLSGSFDAVYGTPVSQSSRGSNTMETISEAEETEDESEVPGDETEGDGNGIHITDIATHKPNFLSDRFNTLYNHNRNNTLSEWQEKNLKDFRTKNPDPESLPREINDTMFLELNGGVSNIHKLRDFESLDDLLPQLDDNDIILAVENKDPGNYTFLVPSEHDTLVVDVMLPASHGFEYLVGLDWDDQWFYICAQTSEDAKEVFQEICRLAGKGERKKLQVDVSSKDDQKHGIKHPLPIETKPMQGSFPNVDIEFERGEVLTPHQASNIAICFERVTFNNCRMASKVVADTFVKAVCKGATLQEIIFYNTEYSVGVEMDASSMTRLVQQSCNNSNAPKLIFQVPIQADGEAGLVMGKSKLPAGVLEATGEEITFALNACENLENRIQFDIGAALKSSFLAMIKRSLKTCVESWPKELAEEGILPIGIIRRDEGNGGTKAAFLEKVKNIISEIKSEQEREAEQEDLVNKRSGDALETSQPEEAIHPSKKPRLHY